MEFLSNKNFQVELLLLQQIEEKSNQFLENLQDNLKMVLKLEIQGKKNIISIKYNFCKGKK